MEKQYTTEKPLTPLAISIEEMGRRMDLSRVIAYRLARSEGFPSVRIGGRIVIPVRELEAWLAEQSKKGQSDGKAV